ncbi:MAG: type I restriction endonuclease subunit R [Gallionella sp.]|nr:type I restriction endonuclease subunit R [Gallionella sp.]MDD4958744.1 type I restriction endonuclease subunit R [Gallionella sp.]
MGWELDDVEKPFVTQLQGLGWTYLEGCIDEPCKTGRSSFAEVIQESVLRRKLAQNNLRDVDGKRVPWLDEARISEAVAAITRIARPKLIEANQVATELLLLGITVDGLPDWDSERGQTIQYIDWAHPEANQFTVINQYRVDCPPGYNSGKAFIIADLVLLVNGIPLVVVECKSPSAPEPLIDAIDQLRRYSNQRHANYEVEDNEGNEPLFFTNQLLIASSFDQARVGTIGALFEHYASWKTIAPYQEEEVAQTLGVAALSEQQRLVAGMLTPDRLLDIVRHFTLFMQTGGQTIKVACRYQQYRAVNQAITRLRHGKTRLQDGEHDQRGGVIWHTQGSGKSLTMVFLVRKLRTDPLLRRFKVVVITDRKDLQRQLSETATLTGEVVEVATTAISVQKLVSRKGPGLLFATIQKYRDPDTADEPGLSKDDMPKNWGVAEPDVHAYDGKPANKNYEVLNDDDAILVIVDEAHRTQAGDLHARLLAGLPNCARIGFTGTPIIMGEKKRTHAIFGEFIDRYTIKESEADGATVPVLYEGRTAQGTVKDGASMDELFEDLFRERSTEELEAIKKKYATKGQIFDAPLLIADKARDMLRHYVTYILPNGYKAQVVAYSRLATIRYAAALETARAELLADADALTPTDKAMDDEVLCQHPAKIQAIVQAWRYRDTLKNIEFAVVISSSNNDDPAWKKWTEGAANELRIKRFKKPLFHVKPEKTDPLAFLIVKSMLLTGFDAPIEGVMYLDRPIREAELLQAIARVNRTGFGKRAGIVVDYYGVAKHLQAALAAYADEDIQGALQSLKDEVSALRDQYMRVMDLFYSRDIESLMDVEACVEVLVDEKLRAEFSVKLKQFLSTLDLVLPRPEGLPFDKDAKTLAYIYARARNRYKDMLVLGKDVGAKVRRLIDEHVISLGIDPKIAPIALTDAKFDQHISRQANDRAKASEMEHAIRSHIRKHLDEDPVLYRKLSERLNEILKNLNQHWDELIGALHKIMSEMREGVAPEDALPDMPAHYVPFLRMLLEAVVGAEHPSDEQLLQIKDLTLELVGLITCEISDTFWEPHKRPAQDALGSQIFRLLKLKRMRFLVDVSALKDRLMELARANHERLIKA